MRARTRVGLVAAGYIAAGVIATLVVAVHAALTANDSRGADGMYAFGDLLLFIAAFGVAAVVPTVLALYLFATRKTERSD